MKSEAELLRELEPMLMAIVNSVKLPSTPVEDREQEARLAALLAIRSFDAKRNVQLRTYVYGNVRNHLLKLVRASKQDKRQLSRAAEIRLDEPFDVDHTASDRETTYHVRVADPEASNPEKLAIESDLFEKVQHKLAKRPARDRDIFLRRVDGEPLSSIGETWGISRERVRQIYEEVLVYARKAA